MHLFSMQPCCSQIYVYSVTVFVLADHLAEYNLMSRESCSTHDAIISASVCLLVCVCLYVAYLLYW